MSDFDALNPVERAAVEVGFAKLSTDAAGNVTLVWPSGAAARITTALPAGPTPQDPPRRPADMPTLELEQLGVPPRPKTVAAIPVNVGPVVPVPPSRFDLPRYPNAARRVWHPK